MTSRTWCKAGETVRIEESRPISKRKRWVVLAGDGEARAPAAEPVATAAKKPRAPRKKKAAAEADARG